MSSFDEVVGGVVSAVLRVSSVLVGLVVAGIYLLAARDTII